MVEVPGAKTGEKKVSGIFGAFSNNMPNMTLTNKIQLICRVLLTWLRTPENESHQQALRT